MHARSPRTSAQRVATRAGCGLVPAAGGWHAAALLLTLHHKRLTAALPRAFRRRLLPPCFAGTTPPQPLLLAPLLAAGTPRAAALQLQLSVRPPGSRCPRAGRRGQLRRGPTLSWRSH
jgi:hypothetical protein